jgi:hypothetical protein
VALQKEEKIIILTKNWVGLHFGRLFHKQHLAALDLAFRGTAKMTILMIATIQPVSAFKKMVTSKNGLRARLHGQGCQIFLVQCTKMGKIYQMSTLKTKRRQ